jgi:hypothetical protein
VSKNCAEDLAYTRGCGSTLHLFVASVLGWLQREQHEIIQYLREENRVLKVQLGGSRIRLTDAQRRRLAAVGTSARSTAADAGRDDRHGEYDSAVAPAADRLQVDVLEAPTGTAGLIP